MNAFFYITAKEAKQHGFTHHGKYLGVPIWIGDTKSDAPIVAAKFVPLEYLVELLESLNGLTFGLVYPDEEPMFKFLVGEPI